MSTPHSGPAFSDDGMWWWDGQTWQPAVSADGRLRWDGWQWRPIPGLPVSQQSVDDRPTAAAPRWPARSIKIAAPAVAIVALVAIGSLLLGHMLAPQMVSGSGYTFQVPQGWSLYRPSDPRQPCAVATPFSVEGKGKAIDIAQRPILPDVNWTPDSIVCGPHQEGAKDYYAIFVYAGISLDQLSFKPPAPWATPGYDAKIPITFPGATRGQEAECSDIGTFPMWCWPVPGGQKSDSVDRNPQLCGPETLAKAGPNNGQWFQQIGRFVSVSHASRDYLIVLSGYDVPVIGFPELHCGGFYQLLQSWKWSG
jgi:hypothetical protein